MAEWEKQTGLKRNEYFATIPSLPLSYEAAHEILKVLAGPNVPSGWQGGLPLAYHVGPGPAEVPMSVAMDYASRKIWNVIATIPGTVEPDRWVMVGNHRDAWVYGAVDPGSGTAATLEMCRALGSAVKNGWKPRRTIVYASWDAEEYGLVGSTEWAEEHAKEVDEKAVLMLNVDSAVSGQELEMSGVPSLRDLTLEAAGAITDPRTGKSLKDALDHLAPRGLGRRRAAGPGRPALGQGRIFRRRAITSPRPRRSPPRWAGSARARTTRPSSITWACRSSTPASKEAMAFITRSTTISTGWRSSAIPSSSRTRRPPGFTP